MNRQENLKKRREKEIIITKVLPKMAKKLAETLDKDVPDINPVVARIMGNLLVSRKISRNADDSARVSIMLKNFSGKTLECTVHEMVPFKIRETTPEPKVISMGNDFDYVWKISVSTGSSKAISYLVDTLSDAEAAKFPELIVEGLDEELVTGAKAIMGLV